MIMLQNYVTSLSKNIAYELNLQSPRKFNLYNSIPKKTKFPSCPIQNLVQMQILCVRGVGLQAVA